MNDLVVSRRGAGCTHVEEADPAHGNGGRRMDLSAVTFLKVAVKVVEREGVAKLRVAAVESDHPRVS